MLKSLNLLITDMRSLWDISEQNYIDINLGRDIINAYDWHLEIDSKKIDIVHYDWDGSSTRENLDYKGKGSKQLFFNYVHAFNFIKKHYRVVNSICGGLLVIVGILMATGVFTKVMTTLN